MEESDEGPEAEGGFNFPLLAESDGKVNVNFEFAALSIESGVTVEIVPVALIDTKLLVAVPAAAWHQQTARRVLPTAGFSKMVPVDVLQCAVGDRTVSLDSSMRIWMGFADQSVVSEMVSADDVECLDYQFLVGVSPGCLPYATSLVDAAQEHFAFLSAEEPVDQVGVGEGASGLVLEDRMSRMELAMESLSSAMTQLLEQRNPDKTRVTFSPSVDRREASKARPRSALLEKYPDLDASVVTAAQAAGVSETALLEMQKLIGAGLPKAKRLQEPTLGQSPKRAAKKNVLSESESEEELQLVDGGSQDGSSNPTVAKSLHQLTKIVSALTLERRKKSQISRVEAALDGISSTGLTDSGTLGSGKKAAAARRVLRSSLLETPEEIYQLVEKYMLEDLSLATQTPGQPAPQLSARAWIEHRSKIGSYKTSAHCAWSAGGILDALISGNTALARARASLLVLMLDQTAVDKGSWVLSSELSLEPPPPMSVLASHVPPNPNDGEAPFSKLLDPRWAEVSLQHLREAEDYAAKRSKLGRKGATDDVDLPKPKLKPKAKAAGSSGSTE